MGTSEGFDAERYLRLLGERGLVLGSEQQHGPHGDTPLGEAARALVAVGVIGADDAQPIVDDYVLAASLRMTGPVVHRLMRSGRRPAATPRPAAPEATRMLKFLRGSLEQPAGTIECRYALLTSERVEIGATWRPPAGTHRRARSGRTRYGPGPAGGPGGVTATDDRGTSVACHFQGGGNEIEWRGQLVSTDPLSLDTAWLELDGVRFQLRPAPARPVATIESPEGAGEPHRYLWHWLARGNRWRMRDGGIEQLIGVLVDAGVMSADDPVLDGVRHVAERIGGPGPPGLRARVPGGGPGAPEHLPEEWRSLLGRRAQQAGGPDGSVAVGASAPPFEGGVITITELTSEEAGFSAEVSIRSDGADSPFGRTELDQSWIAWWAADDRGNWYLGDVGQWSGGAGTGHGTVGFGPPLDARATELRLMPTTLHERAVIPVRLDWESEQ